MAAPIYAEFDSTMANAAADIKTKILTSSDWASLTGAGLTTAVKATTTRGAQMVVDFADAAVTSLRLQCAVYRTHDGTTAVDKVNRFLSTRTSGGATSDVVHIAVSAGKESLFVSIEGPRPGELNAVATDGSWKQCLFLGDVLPYFAGDTIPSVLLVGSPTSGTFIGAQTVNVSRNAANNASWVPAYLASITTPDVSTAAAWGNLTNQASGDSNFYLWPWLVVEQAAGLRGRLGSCFFVGFNASWLADYPITPGQKFSYGGVNYTALAPMKGTASVQSISGFGAGGGTSGSSNSPIIAVVSP